MRHGRQSTVARASERKPALFVIAVQMIKHGKCKWVGEYGHRVGKPHTIVVSLIAGSFERIPIGIISSLEEYTLPLRRNKRLVNDNSRREDGVIWLRPGRYLLALRLSLTLAFSRRERELKRGRENGSQDDVGTHQLFR